ncbi:MAG TPA: ATP-grasp domain-containing protein [Dehalococcoidia bacterium]|nr:ATP-grasp domain-containing protein [Dehalococcoidia bacterium]
MRFYEYEAKRLLKKQLIGVPVHQLVRTVEETREAASQIGFPVVLKAQVLSGGRMKAGGVKFAACVDEVVEAAPNILKLKIKGKTPVGILVEPKCVVQQEYYLGVTYDAAAKLPIVIFSDLGGIDIEEASERNPERVAKSHISALLPFYDFQAKQLVNSVGITGRDLNSLTQIFSRLVRTFLDYDLTLAEINPLAKLSDGSFVALDAHVEMEDVAITRHSQTLSELGISRRYEATDLTQFEKRAAEMFSGKGWVAGTMVDFGGPMALLTTGGGTSLVIFDSVRKQGGNPANFCDTGGNFGVDKVYQMTKLLLEKPGVEKIAVITCVFSVARVDLIVRGVIKALLEKAYSPAEKIAVFRVPGAWEEEGFRILRKYNVNFLDRSYTIDDAVREAIRRME